MAVRRVHCEPVKKTSYSTSWKSHSDNPDHDGKQSICKVHLIIIRVHNGISIFFRPWNTVINDVADQLINNLFWCLNFRSSSTVIGMSSTVAGMLECMRKRADLFVFCKVSSTKRSQIFKEINCMSACIQELVRLRSYFERGWKPRNEIWVPSLLQSHFDTAAWFLLAKILKVAWSLILNDTYLPCVSDPFGDKCLSWTNFSIFLHFICRNF